MVSLEDKKHGQEEAPGKHKRATMRRTWLARNSNFSIHSILMPMRHDEVDHLGTFLQMNILEVILLWNILSAMNQIESLCELMVNDLVRQVQQNQESNPNSNGNGFWNFVIFFILSFFSVVYPHSFNTRSSFNQSLNDSILKDLYNSSMNLSLKTDSILEDLNRIKEVLTKKFLGQLESSYWRFASSESFKLPKEDPVDSSVSPERPSNRSTETDLY